MQPNLNSFIDQVSKEKGISREVLIETVKQAIVTAAKRSFGVEYELESEYNDEEGTVDLYQIVNVVDVVSRPGREILVDDAHRHDPEAQVGDELLFQVFYRPEDAARAKKQDRDLGRILGLKTAGHHFGRIAAQTAKQVIAQRVHEAERENVYREYKDRKGENINGVVRRFERGNLIVDLGRAEAILPVREQIARESYRVGDRVVAYVLDIDRMARGPQIILSRTHRGLLIKLFENEVPEAYEGIVRIESAAREPGARAKIAVSSRDPDIDPVGACVGMKGSRVQAVVQDLRGEKIDIVPYDEDPARFVCNSIAPADVSQVLIDAESHTMELVVPDDKLSLAIGRRGQNVRLASQLTGWRIDIHSETKVRELEQQSKRSLCEIEGLNTVLADTMFKLGWRSAADIAHAASDDLASIPGIGGSEKASAIIAAAKVADLEQKKWAEERHQWLLEEAKKSDAERWLSVEGMSEEIASRLQKRYATIEQLGREHDLLRMAVVGGLSRSRAKALHWATRTYLGEIDPRGPKPEIDESEEVEQSEERVWPRSDLDLARE